MRQPVIIPVPHLNGYKTVFEYYQAGVTVPPKYFFNGASIPRAVKSVMQGAFWPKYTAAALIHDYLYDIQIISRKSADKLFYDMLRENDVNKYMAWTMYKSVRALGWMSW